MTLPEAAALSTVFDFAEVLSAVPIGAESDGVRVTRQQTFASRDNENAFHDFMGGDRSSLWRRDQETFTSVR